MSESAILINQIGIVVGFTLFAIKKMMSVLQLISSCQRIA